MPPGGEPFTGKCFGGAGGEASLPGRGVSPLSPFPPLGTQAQIVTEQET